MNIEPINSAYFDLVEIIKGTPHCKKHGAMNKITQDGFWRCLSVTGYKLEFNGNSRSEIHRETICRAGCKQLPNRPDTD